MEDWLEPVYDAEQMRAADSWAIDTRGVPSLHLMETAGAAVAQAAREVSRPGPAKVVCGKGNNGGDGLVAARLLDRDRHRDAEALLLWPPEELSGDARANLERCDRVRQVDPGELASELAGAGVVVDAIFGTGFSGAPRAPAEAAIEAINGCGAAVVAADIPSGVDAATGEAAGAAVRANLTVTFHMPKLGHWIAPGKWCRGELRTVEIGIPEGEPVEAVAGLIRPEVLRLAPHRGPRSTKFSSGKVVIVGGSRGLTGAVCMAASAAVRAGVGYAIVAVPAELEPIFEAKLTEVMSVGCPSVDGHLAPGAADRVLDACSGAGAVILGCGLGRSEPAAELARALAAGVDAPLLVDADGLGALVGRLELLAGRSAATVLTPHAGELGRLLGSDSATVGARRLSSAREAAASSGAVVALKGDDTLVVDSSRAAINALPAPALATAGTGDVLAGVIGALVARGLDPFTGACAGVIAHARAGRDAGERIGPDSVIAGDVIQALPGALAF